MAIVLRDKFEMLSNMTPSLKEGEYVFCSIPNEGSKAHNLNPIATFHEKEGLTVILEKGEAHEAGFETSLAMRQITLDVNSALDGVGLTAGVAASLAEAGIPCNMVAAYHHDHIFVPTGLADRALHLLERLQRESARAMRNVNEL
ncbi:MULTISPECIES: ACT domain-containing protein [Rhizobium]|uniref:ACT domain-containing protein n=1 Tax=Rhizobium TaxID=379 RepID=UPI001B338635|nr:MULTISPECIES: ACT domain-containing protein [Rhizobium]MBX4911027.1 ACT domain-containing protein [Rhizobium bangladeshense]MBX4949099.1 ACT domain-containing protein [Rhizobium binae]MBX4964048.1 ACT domain-containing protein [Rhizobium binae]MBX5254029.1 ACT domain-containing protein [Rhizobium sp. NLR4b]MBX5260144.1 ACT domain-containing protein [Rhizobium sp. NLR16b]